MIRVSIPSQLRDYVAGAKEVPAEGATLCAVFDDLDRRFPGLRFRVIDEQGRVRRHMVVFVDGEREEDLSRALRPGAEVFVIGALSGG